MKCFLLNSISPILCIVISSFGMKSIIVSRNISDVVMYGTSSRKNDSKDMFDVVYMTMLCGAPIGSIMHPTFAAIVCRHTVIIIRSARNTFFSAVIANGTNIISDTSFVMKMELMKDMSISIETSCLVFPIFTSSFRISFSNTARFFSISTINIIINSSMIVSQLI